MFLSQILAVSSTACRKIVSNTAVRNDVAFLQLIVARPAVKTTARFETSLGTSSKGTVSRQQHLKIKKFFYNWQASW
jgi:hypothetical protein